MEQDCPFTISNNLNGSKLTSPHRSLWTAPHTHTFSSGNSRELDTIVIPWISSFSSADNLCMLHLFVTKKLCPIYFHQPCLCYHSSKLLDFFLWHFLPSSSHSLHPLTMIYFSFFMLFLLLKHTQPPFSDYTREFTVMYQVLWLIISRFLLSFVSMGIMPFQ